MSWEPSSSAECTPEVGGQFLARAALRVPTLDLVLPSRPCSSCSDTSPREPWELRPARVSLEHFHPASDACRAATAGVTFTGSEEGSPPSPRKAESGAGSSFCADAPSHAGTSLCAHVGSHAASSASGGPQMADSVLSRLMAAASKLSRFCGARAEDLPVGIDAAQMCSRGDLALRSWPLSRLAIVRHLWRHTPCREHRKPSEGISSTFGTPPAAIKCLAAHMRSE